MTSGGLSGGLYKPLSDGGVKTIHNHALSLLEQVGMGYEAGFEETVDMVKKAGCRVDSQKQRIYFPRDLVCRMVAKAPGEFTLFSRDGQNNLHLGKDRVYCGTGGTAIRILDLDTGEPRTPVVRDLHNVARIVEKMKNIHFFQHCCVPTDVPPEHYDVNGVFAAMLGTLKHCMIGCTYDSGLRETFKMVSLIVGGEDRLSERPVFSISSGVIISPLKFCTQSVKNACQAAKLGIPTTITSAPMSGSTAPMTMAGTLLQTHAEELAGITVHQLTRPGAPVLYGGLPAMAEMKSLGYQGGAVEVGIMMAAIHQLSQHIGIPNYSSSGLADSKLPDAQAGWEKAYTTALNVMGGCNYVHHAAGMLESMICIAYEQYILDDEIIGQAMKILEGITVDEDHLAYEVICNAGPSGNYLTTPHTFSHLRSEYFQGNGVSDKQRRKDWQKNGKKSARQRAQQMAKAILSEPLDAKIPPDIEKNIRKRFPIYLSE